MQKKIGIISKWYIFKCESGTVLNEYRQVLKMLFGEKASQLLNK